MKKIYSERHSPFKVLPTELQGLSNERLAENENTPIWKLEELARKDVYYGQFLMKRKNLPIVVWEALLDFATPGGEYAKDIVEAMLRELLTNEHIHLYPSAVIKSQYTEEKDLIRWISEGVTELIDELCYDILQKKNLIERGWDIVYDKRNRVTPKVIDTILSIKNKKLISDNVRKRLEEVKIGL